MQRKSDAEESLVPQTTAGSGTRQPSPEKPRWRRRLLMVLMGGVVLATLFHGPLLTALARQLVLEEDVTPGDILFIHSGDRRFELAGEFYDAGLVSTVWLVRRYPDYLVREGILPPQHVAARDALRAVGIPDSAIVVLAGESQGDDDTARIVGGELAGRPDVRVVMLCDRFNCRYLREVFDSLLAPAHSAQVALRGLPDAEFDETNWWCARRGVKAVLIATTDLLHLALAGASSLHPPDWNPDTYERQLRTATAGSTCHET